MAIPEPSLSAVPLSPEAALWIWARLAVALALSGAIERFPMTLVCCPRCSIGAIHAGIGRVALASLIPGGGGVEFQCHRGSCKRRYTVGAVLRGDGPVTYRLRGPGRDARPGEWEIAPDGRLGGLV